MPITSYFTKNNRQMSFSYNLISVVRAGTVSYTHLSRSIISLTNLGPTFESYPFCHPASSSI